MSNIEQLKGQDWFDFKDRLLETLFNEECFSENYTRKESQQIIRRLKYIELKRKSEWTRKLSYSSITKRRAYQHIKFWFALHGYDVQRGRKTNEK